MRLFLALQRLTRPCLTHLAGVVVVFALAAPAPAQVSLLSREVQSAMTATGSTWNQSLRPDLSAMREAFAALHAAAPKDGVVVTKDVAYGPHLRNILDVYKPSRGSSPSPAVIFVHGGAYVGGDKSYYGNVTTWFARQGMLGVNATYRLAPSAKWPAATEDIAGMVSGPGRMQRALAAIQTASSSSVIPPVRRMSQTTSSTGACSRPAVLVLPARC